MEQKTKQQAFGGDFVCGKKLMKKKGTSNMTKQDKKWWWRRSKPKSWRIGWSFWWLKKLKNKEEKETDLDKLRGEDKEEIKQKIQEVVKNPAEVIQNLEETKTRTDDETFAQVFKKLKEENVKILSEEVFYKLEEEEEDNEVKTW